MQIVGTPPSKVGIMILTLLMSLAFTGNGQSISCDDISEGTKVYDISSTSSNGDIVHHFNFQYLFFTVPSTDFDFDNGQLTVDENTATLTGTLTLVSGGNSNNPAGSQWIIYLQFDATTSTNPDTEIGQGAALTDTWQYYMIDPSPSYMYNIARPSSVVTFTEKETPLQVGLGANNKEINTFGASDSWYTTRGSGSGTADMHINLADACPAESEISPILECVEYRESDDTYIAHFGYLNENNEEVIIPIGANNNFTPSPADRGQTFYFEPGRHESVFQVEFDGSDLVWTLTSPNSTTKTSTASDNPSQSCDVSTAPTATISGQAQVCEGESAFFTIDLTGEQPWVVTYDHQLQTTTLNISTTPYTLEVTEVGAYSLVSVEDKNGLAGAASGSATLSFFDQPTATILGGGNFCADQQTASVSVDLTGTAPWTFTYTDGSNNTEVTTHDANHQFDAATGSYSLVSVQDAHCSGEVSGEAVVEQRATPTAILSGGGSVCDDQQTAAINIELTGEAPWSITYSNGTSNTEVITQDANYQFDATPGSYSLIAVQDAHCSGEVSGEAVVEISTPSAQLSGGGEICNKIESATIEVALTGTAPWTFTYTNGTENYNIVTSDNPYTFDATTPETYELVSMTDALCDGTISGVAHITLKTLSGTFTLEDDYCSGKIPLTAQISGTPTSYLWTVSGTKSKIINPNSPNAYYNTKSGDSLLTFTLSVTDECSSLELSASTTVINPDASFEILPDTQDEPLLLSVPYTFVPANSDADSYLWVFGDGEESTAMQPTHSYNAAGVYNISLTVTEKGCLQVANETIEVRPNTLFIPNVFSPTSSNSENSVVKVYGENINGNNFTFQIYNRWGKIVYNTRNITEAQEKGWNGRSNGEEQGNNVFTYVVRGQYNNGQTFEKTGTITLAK